MSISIWPKTILSLGLGAIAVVAPWPARADVMADPSGAVLPRTEGSAQDLQGTLAKDGSLWLAGVGGEGDIEDSQGEDPYTITKKSNLQPQPPHRLPLAPSQLQLSIGQF